MKYKTFLKNCYKLIVYEWRQLYSWEKLKIRVNVFSLYYIINWTFDGKWFSLAVPCVYPLSSNTIFFVCFSLTTSKQQSKDCSLCKRNLIWRDQILGLVNSGYNHDHMFIVVFLSLVSRIWWLVLSVIFVCPRRHHKIRDYKYCGDLKYHRYDQFN